MSHVLTFDHSWRRIKVDYLYHFSKPRIDLLAWILVVKLAPSYYKKLDHLLHDTGRFQELSSWRKSFKSEWQRLVKTPVTMPMNPKYRPDVRRWVCTCPYFVKSRFLVCKHLVQGVQTVSPIFFLEVQRNRTLPFWSHPSLIPLNETLPIESTAPSEEGRIHTDAGGSVSDEREDEEEENDIVDTAAGRQVDTHTFQERFQTLIKNFRDFSDGLEYQIQFNDHRMLNAVEREGASFIRLMENCLDRER